MNLSMLLEMAADAGGDRIAVGTRRDGLTYRELLELSRRYGSQIGQLDAQALAYLDLNSPTCVALLFGCSYAGVPFAPINYRWTDQQVGRALERLAPVAVVAGGDFTARVEPSSSISLLNLATVGAATEAIEARNEDSPAVLLFTSGTSGDPKAAVLRSSNLVPYVVSTIEFFNAGPEEAILVSVPPYHIASVSSALTSVYSGRRIVQLPAFDPESWVDLAADEAITHAMVVPTMLGRILDVLERRGQRLDALRHLSYGGGRMPVETVERALSLLPGVGLVNAYGLTETSSTIAVLGPEDHRIAAASEDPLVRARLGSVGLPIPSIELEVRSEDGTVLSAGAAGEVWVRGEQVSGEYLSHSAVQEDGWYPTRDHGHLDVDGYLFLHGRADDVIVRGGENIAPAEIEDCLRSHEAVADVAVVGVPDPEWGERVEAVVVLAPGAASDSAEFQEMVRAALRSTRVPARVHYRDELPYNELGKLLRREVRIELTALVKEVSA
ncbi:class I adenylate-forming enzyme family protein [Rhodococcus sp. OK302]|uniref:class I adenylate-forming enzyme family protein n=1 Tax=Rhodococcus sp. OK302 TaxID=1882769 RepID=UPI000B9458D5|nr:long-chain fatty acid--CoA ligase [Rhodococcus sp. OK302]OYD61413.1 acyl-CoA synthetase (AMP-forming)/AMP-acid ligase II [Rhodococcus sp. OK302]